MSKAYAPRFSTILLVNDMARFPGVSRVSLIAPNSREGARIQVTFLNGEKVMFTLPTARLWVKAQKG